MPDLGVLHPHGCLLQLTSKRLGRVESSVYSFFFWCFPIRFLDLLSTNFNTLPVMDPRTHTLSPNSKTLRKLRKFYTQPRHQRKSYQWG